jgi:hypothetical protein
MSHNSAKKNNQPKKPCNMLSINPVKFHLNCISGIRGVVQTNLIKSFKGHTGKSKNGTAKRDRQTDDGEMIPICRHYSVEATQNEYY